jgi:hypothetical protein
MSLPKELRNSVRLGVYKYLAPNGADLLLRISLEIVAFSQTVA